MKKKDVPICIPGNDPLIIARQMAEQGITLVRGIANEKISNTILTLES